MSINKYRVIPFTIYDTDGKSTDIFYVIYYGGLDLQPWNNEPEHYYGSKYSRYFYLKSVDDVKRKIKSYIGTLPCKLPVFIPDLSDLKSDDVVYQYHNNMVDFINKYYKDMVNIFYLPRGFKKVDIEKLSYKGTFLSRGKYQMRASQGFGPSIVPYNQQVSITSISAAGQFTDRAVFNQLTFFGKKDSDDWEVGFNIFVAPDYNAPFPEYPTYEYTNITDPKALQNIYIYIERVDEKVYEGKYRLTIAANNGNRFDTRVVEGVFMFMNDFELPPQPPEPPEPPEPIPPEPIPPDTPPEKSTIFTNTSDRLTVNKLLESVAEVDLIYRQPTDILNPTIQLSGDEELIGNVLTKGNYIYIKDFNRYYYITGMQVLRTGLLELTCHVDVLMSHRSQYLKLPAVIARQSDEFNLNLPDRDVVLSAKPIIKTQQFDQGFNDYSIVVAVNGKQELQ